MPSRSLRSTRDIPSSTAMFAFALLASALVLLLFVHGPGAVAFLFVIGRTFMAKHFTHEQAVTAIVVSYYWHFVDVVWIALFATLYIL